MYADAEYADAEFDSEPEAETGGPRTVKHLPLSDRPRERLLRGGGPALTDAELIAILLRVGRPGQSAIVMAQELLDEHGSLNGLLEADLGTLQRHGLRKAKACAILAAVELGRRLARIKVPDEAPLEHPDAVASYLLLRYGHGDQEVMGALFLDVRNRLVAESDFYRGTLSRAAVEPRAILSEALRRRAAGLILFHTHPSGDPSPSVEDLRFTRRMAEAGELLGIRLVDHLILGAAGHWVSLRRRGAW